jgi:hypothetical protein
LAVTSLILGTVGMVAGAVRSRDARMYVFGPTFRWNYPPAAIVPPLYLAAVIVAIGVSAFLATTGIVSLVRPASVVRLHLLYAFMKLPLVGLTAVLRMLLLSPNPNTTAFLLASEVAFECLLCGAYPAIALFVVWRQARTTQPEHDGPAAG